MKSERLEDACSQDTSTPRVGTTRQVTLRKLLWSVDSLARTIRRDIADGIHIVAVGRNHAKMFDTHHKGRFD